VLNVYTMDQIHAFDEAAQRNTATELVDLATAFRMASDPKGDAWKRYVEHLTARTKRKPRGRKEAPSVMTREQAAALRHMTSRKVN
jgi:hypothetical protein